MSTAGLVEEDFTLKQIYAVEDLLRFWKNEELIQQFQDEEIDLSSLKAMNDNDFMRILPKMGPRKLFMKKVESWIQSGCPNLIVTVGEAEPFLSPSISQLEQSDIVVAGLPEVESVECAITQHSTSSLGTVSRPISTESISPAPNTGTVASVTHGEQARKIKKCNRQIRNAASKYLTSVIGQKLMAKYDKGEFEDKHRQELSDQIVQGEFASDTNKVISPQRFVELAACISQIFEGEIEHLYYIPRRTVDGETTGPKGKLYNVYRNCAKELTAAGLRKSIRRIHVDECVEEPTGTTYEDLVWLSTRKEPWDIVCQKWNNISNTRSSELRLVRRAVKKKKSDGNLLDGITEYMSRYPCLLQPIGYTLLELDFANLYPGSDLKLATGWAKFSQAVCAISGISYQENLPQLVIFQAFAKLFDPQTLKGTKRRSTKQEVVEGFILHTQVIDDLDPLINRMQEKARQLKQTVQPFAVVIGLTAASITSSFVVIDAVKYDVESPLRAVDIAFKSFHALHARYPLQSEGPWLLLQQAVYGIKTQWDGVIPRVISLMQKFDH